MTRGHRLVAEATAAWRAFRRRRTAMFFTFAFPLLLVGIFGALVTTSAAGTAGLFTKPPAYYIPGYLAVVVLFTPLTRVGSTVARHRSGNRFEKLATTPLARWEWLAAHTLVNAVVVGVASALVLAVVVGVTAASVRLVAVPAIAALVGVAVVVFCGIGAVLGRVAESRDGVVAASNAIAVPLVFLSETFVPPSLLPPWFRPVMGLSPLTYFSRAVRAVGVTGDPWLGDAAVLVGAAVVAFLAGAVAIPQTD
ncbi:MAG: ABC transporter permease [Halobacteriaceae archaeon]